MCVCERGREREKERRERVRIIKYLVSDATEYSTQLLVTVVAAGFKEKHK